MREVEFEIFDLRFEIFEIDGRREKPGLKNNGRKNPGGLSLPFSASLQWLCPSTIEEEEVI